MGKHFIERPNERNTAGIFAILNELVFCALSEIEWGEGLSCIHSPSIERVATVNQDSEDCSGLSDVREYNLLHGHVDPNGAHQIAVRLNLKAKKRALESVLELRDFDALTRSAMEVIAPRTLGLHLRGTDKRSEVIPPSTRALKQAIDSFILEHRVTSIFLSTDDSKYLRFVEKNWPALMVPREYPLSRTNRKPLHLNLENDDLVAESDHGAMKDAVALASCDFFLYSASNLSHFALTLGADSHVAIQALPKNESVARWLAYKFGNIAIDLRVGVLRKLKKLSRSALSKLDTRGVLLGKESDKGIF
jgi:hypothetical protein